ncbi:Chromosomal replication initiator protein DnaA [Geodia barretti]|uniref:Chromosomal replication initiator protein DnaA n=1 Tax=Geodia barretti TaxID=519541 RepID=A0AA35W3B4_GEOBA|nr:Chromosomal replication initiator protein DnaA [Geodia barretti]
MYQTILRALRQASGDLLDVRFQVSAEVGVDEVQPPSVSRNGNGNGIKNRLRPGSARDPPTPRCPPAPHTSTQYSQQLVVGVSNRMAFSAAQAVADAPGQAYNPLFLYSGVGLGKTHLLHAIGQKAARNGSSVLYVSSEHSLKKRTAHLRIRTGHRAFRRARYRSLASRSNGGLIADIQPPDLETRMAILGSKADQLKTIIEESVLELIAKRVQKNVRELEGSLNRVRAYSQLMNTPITLDSTSRLLDDLTQDTARHAIDPERILEEVGRQYKVAASDLLGRSRSKTIALARQVAMYLLIYELELSPTQAKLR